MTYDNPFEITEKQNNALKQAGATGFGAFRKDEFGKFWFKIWIMKQKKFIDKILKANE